ncbi:MAG: hypothetical protein O9350_19710 [Microcystis sp. LE19-388.1G]|nr:hypothetical protein [Microcystis sp. LE19-388.1G]
MGKWGSGETVSSPYHPKTPRNGSTELRARSDHPISCLLMANRFYHDRNLGRRQEV